MAFLSRASRILKLLLLSSSLLLLLRLPAGSCDEVRVCSSADDTCANAGPAMGIESVMEERQRLLKQQEELRLLLSHATKSLSELSDVVKRQDEALHQMSAGSTTGGTPLSGSTVNGDHPSYQEVHGAGAVHDGSGAMYSGLGASLAAVNSEEPSGDLEGFTEGGFGARPHTVLRAHKSWGDYLTFLAAVRVSGSVTSINVLNERTPSRNAPLVGALPHHVVLGDGGGRLYFFSPQGDLAREYNTGTPSAISFLSSLYIRRNQTVLVSGHANGEVRIHLVTTEHFMRKRRTHEEEEDIKARGGIADVSLHLVSEPLASGGSSESRSKKSGASESGTIEMAADGDFGTMEPGIAAGLVMTVNSTLLGPPQISHLVAFRQKGGKKLLAIWYSNPPAMTVLHMLDGSTVYSTRTNHTALAAHINGGVAVSLSGKHATAVVGSWLVPPIELVCEGLNGSLMVSACYDSGRAFRAHALTDRGELLTLTVPSDRSKPICKVVHSQPFALPPGGPISMTSLRGGYLILAHPAGVVVLNMSHTLGGVEPITLESTATLAASMGQDNAEVSKPILSSSGEKMSGFVALALGAGLVAFFDAGAALTLPRALIPPPATSMWTQPVFVGLMIVVAVFQFNKARARAQYEPAGLGRGGGGGQRGRGGGTQRGGKGVEEATCPEALFQEALKHLSRQHAGAVPCRSARRAARMGQAPPMPRHMSPTIEEGEEEEENNE